MSTQANFSQANRREHALFKHFPLNGEAQLSIGKVPTPYQVYDGYGLFIGGTADLAPARDLLGPESVRPVETVSGRALMGVWVFDFTSASLGAHHEFQLSIFATATPVAAVTAHPLGLIKLMLTRPDVSMLCHGLWNNTDEVVAYNRELLALNARSSRSVIERDAHSMKFAVSDRDSGNAVVRGRIQSHFRQSLRANLALTSQLGIRRILAIAREPWIKMQILNPVSERMQCNASADSYTHSDVSVLRYFDSTHDELTIGHGVYRQLNFQPQFVQYLEGFKFVYLTPDRFRQSIRA